MRAESSSGAGAVGIEVDGGGVDGGLVVKESVVLQAQLQPRFGDELRRLARTGF